MQNDAAKSLIGCCGLYCGLCNKYQSEAPSRCIGCVLGEQHSWCSIWNCCAKNHGFGTCVECSEMAACEIFLRRRVAEWIPAIDNLHQIREVGLETWTKEQKERQSLVEELLRNYNEGRSMSFLCKACARMPIDVIHDAVRESKKKIAIDEIDKSDMKAKAKILKSAIKDKAAKYHINVD